TTTRADDASWLEVSWNAPNYGHVTRIGKSAEFDSEWATPVDETAGSLPAGFSYTFDPGDPAMDGPVWITLYGWLGDAGRPNHTEFYVVQGWRGTPPSTEAGMEAKGSYTFDGVVYNVFHSVHPMGHQQWFSVRETPATSGSVDVKDHLDVWRAQGMENSPITELVWAVEGMANTDGTVRYTQWSVPDLRSGAGGAVPAETATPEADAPEEAEPAAPETEQPAGEAPDAEEPVTPDAEQPEMPVYDKTTYDHTRESWRNRWTLFSGMFGGGMFGEAPPIP
ncbi:MAG: glycoside hydrolase family 11 protein, partial [Nocardioides sp.]